MVQDLSIGVAVIVVIAGAVSGYVEIVAAGKLIWDGVQNIPQLLNPPVQ